MPNTNKLDYLQIDHMHITVLVFAMQKLAKSFIFSATELQYYATIVISCKQHFKRILALAADSKKVVKHA